MDSAGIHLIQCFLDLDPVPVILLLEGLDIVFAGLADIPQHALHTGLQPLMILPDGILAVGPDFVELPLHHLPVALQSLMQHLVDQVHRALHLLVAQCGALRGEFVQLFGGMLQETVILVQFLVQGPDYLLFLL